MLEIMKKNITIPIKFSKGDRVWMPDGKGGETKGRVVKIMLFLADMSEPPERISSKWMNYHCIDEQKNLHVFHEYQLRERNL